MKRSVGIVTLGEIRDAVISLSNASDDESISFIEFSKCIQDLHTKKLGDDYTANKLGDSYAKTATEISGINYVNFDKADQHFVESISNLYNTIVYTMVLLTIKKSNNQNIVQNAERDIKPLIKRHWDNFVQLNSLDT